MRERAAAGGVPSLSAPLRSMQHRSAASVIPSAAPRPLLMGSRDRQHWCCAAIQGLTRGGLCIGDGSRSLAHVHLDGGGGRCRLCNSGTGQRRVGWRQCRLLLCLCREGAEKLGGRLATLGGAMQWRQYWSCSHGAPSMRCTILWVISSAQQLGAHPIPAPHRTHSPRLGVAGACCSGGGTRTGMIGSSSSPLSCRQGW